MEKSNFLRVRPKAKQIFLIIRPIRCELYWDLNVILNLCTVTLRDTLGNPDNVAHFLLLQFDERIENAKVELVQICVHIQFYLKIRVKSKWS